MIGRLGLVLISTIFHSLIFSQTIIWDDNKQKGSIRYDNEEITILVVGFFEKSEEFSRAAEIYNENRYEFQSQLSDILENSGLNYKLVFRSQYDDSTFIDTDKYPIVIDHSLRNKSMPSNNGGSTMYSFLQLWVLDRRTDFNARIRLNSQSTKYAKVFKKFFRKLEKGKRIKLFNK